MMEHEKKVVLFADDEEGFLRTVADGFALHADRVTLLTAANGKIASEILTRRPIDLLVTDLKMPEMDGFALISHLSRVRPGVPVIVMTAFGTAEIESKLDELGIVQYLEKPMDFPELAEKVFASLEASASGHLSGIALPTVLQMIEIDRKTCTVCVTSRDHIGELSFRAGALVDATTGSLRGSDAAMEIVCWETPEIDILSGGPQSTRTPAKSLDLSVTQVLLEAFRAQDERERDRQRALRRATMPGPGPVPAPKLTPAAGMKAVSAPPSAPRGDSLFPPPAGPKELQKKEHVDMSAQEKLKELTSIDGFSGAALYTPQGELLSVLAGEVGNLKEIGVLANNVLMNAQRASLEMGTGRGQQVHIEAEHSNILVRCLNEGTDPLRSQPNKAHIHMVVVLKSDAAIGMAKLRVSSVIQKLAEDFRM